jgi:UDP-2,3-diacylglucosamine pyrophosphatase LpxH
MKRAKRGTRVTYIPGNHDEVFRQFAGMDFGGVKIRRKAIHTTADGRRLLVLHGDEFDAITLAHRWVAFIGDSAYTALMVVNQWLNVARRWLGLPYWSLSKHAKAKVKNAVAFISHFEEVVAHAAGSRGVDGVVCGHIHTAEIRDIQGVAYYNDGDWVEGCTALVEHFDGRMELLHWADEIAARNAPASTDSVTRAA